METARPQPRQRRHSISGSYVEVPRAFWRMYSLHYIAIEDIIMSATARLDRLLSVLYHYQETVAAVQCYSEFLKFSKLESSFRSDLIDYMFGLQMDLSRVAENQIRICSDFDYEAKRIADDIGANKENKIPRKLPWRTKKLGGETEPKLNKTSKDVREEIKRRVAEAKSVWEDEDKLAKRRVSFSNLEQNTSTDYISEDNTNKGICAGNSKKKYDGARKGILVKKSTVSIFTFLRRTESLDSVRAVTRESPPQQVLQELWRRGAVLGGVLTRHEAAVWQLAQLRRDLLVADESALAMVQRLRGTLLQLLHCAVVELWAARQELEFCDAAVRRLALQTWRSGGAFPHADDRPRPPPQQAPLPSRPGPLRILLTAALRFLFCIPANVSQ